jgi:hypothetical protein
MSATKTRRCWNCQKRIEVPADNDNIYTRVCKACERRIK